MSNKICPLCGMNDISMAHGPQFGNCAGLIKRKPKIIFDDDSQGLIFEALGITTDEEGYLFLDGELATDHKGRKVHIDNFAGITGKKLFQKDQIEDLIIKN